jgi:DNA-binding MarR family transcriptional regulator
LSRQKLITRTPDSVDRRVVRVYATDAASPIINQLTQIVEDGTQEALAGFNGEEQSQLFDYLERIITNLNRN